MISTRATAAAWCVAATPSSGSASRRPGRLVRPIAEPAVGASLTWTSLRDHRRSVRSLMQNDFWSGTDQDNYAVHVV